MAAGEGAAGRGIERGGASLAQELRRWAAEEMKLPPNKVPSESAARRMCSGQCADIWRYITCHVYHQRTVKKIRGNLLWYQQMEESEGKPSGTESDKEHRKQLVQKITHLREELQQVDLQIESAQRELVASEINLEAAQEKIRDTKRRSLLLKAYSARVMVERQQLHSKADQVKGRLEEMVEMEKKAKTTVAFGDKIPECGFPTMVPEVLHDVQEACQLRFQFLKTLFEHSVPGSISGGQNEEQLNATYQRWLNRVEKVVGTHPPAHILSALEHLALQSMHQLQELTDKINIPRDVAALKFRYDSTHLQDVSSSSDHLPSVLGLIQEGWAECEMLCLQQIPLHAQEKNLQDQLEAIVKEMHRLLSDGSEQSILARAVFELELRAVRLRGYRDGLLRGCQQLEGVVKARYAELQNLKTKRQRILDFRHLVNEKQQHIRALIKGTSFIKSQFRKEQAEIQDFVQKKLLPLAQQVGEEAQQLHNRVDREVRQFRAIALPCLLTRQVAGAHHVPAHELSIYRLSRISLAENRPFHNVCNGADFPLYKAPDQLLLHMAELKKRLACLRAQLGSKQRALGSVQHQLDNASEPDIAGLVREVQSHSQKQASELLPRIQRMSDQCRCCIERWPDIQAKMDAWWEQPGQFALPSERRHGFTLQQWLERWTMAAKALQQQQSWL